MDLVGRDIHHCRESPGNFITFMFMPQCMVTPNSNPSTSSGSYPDDDEDDGGGDGVGVGALWLRKRTKYLILKWLGRWRCR
jgi:hypothetical protein